MYTSTQIFLQHCYSNLLLLITIRSYVLVGRREKTTVGLVVSGYKSRIK